MAARSTARAHVFTTRGSARPCGQVDEAPSQPMRFLDFSGENTHQNDGHRKVALRPGQEDTFGHQDWSAHCDSQPMRPASRETTGSPTAGRTRGHCAVGSQSDTAVSWRTATLRQAHPWAGDHHNISLVSQTVVRRNFDFKLAWHIRKF